jgi:UDP-glucose:(heptosyl)LPS alpha-1,3-glucosyltransferase
VAFVLDHYRPGKGGLENWLAAFAAHLSAAGRAVHLVSMDDVRPPAPFVHHPILPRSWTRAGRDREFAGRAAEHVKREGFRAVVGLRHCVFCHLYAPHGGSVAASFAGRRWPSRRVRTFLRLERELLAGPEAPARILAVSDMVRRDLAGRYPDVAGAIRVVPNGVDLGRFSPEGREAARAALAPEGGRIALFLAGNPRLKGIRTAARAFALLRARGVADAMLVAGGPPGRLPDGARYLGRLSRPEQALRAADVLLLPTSYDPFPLTVLEALACGTPVATTERNGALDHVGRDGPVRAVVEPGDAEGLAAAAAALLAEAPRAAARRRAEAFPLEASLAAAASLLPG